MAYKNYQEHLDKARERYLRNRTSTREYKKRLTPEQKKEYGRKWRENNKERFYVGVRRSESLKPEQYRNMHRNSYYKSTYGISLNDYNRMFQIQGGRCAICLKHQSDVKKSLAVDHHHKTGKVRALLCPGCNMVLGMIEVHGHKVFDYLKKHEETSISTEEIKR